MVRFSKFAGVCSCALFLLFAFVTQHSLIESCSAQQVAARIGEDLRPWNPGDLPTNPDPDPEITPPPWDPNWCIHGAYAPCALEAIDYLAPDYEMSCLHPVQSTYEAVCADDSVRKKLIFIQFGWLYYTPTDYQECMAHIAEFSEWETCWTTPVAWGTNCFHLLDARMKELGKPIVSQYCSCWKAYPCFLLGNNYAELYE